jgi:HEAT repeat protein
MDTLAKIARLLEHESQRTRIAAAVVLGELKSRDPAVLNGLHAMARHADEARAVAAVEALGQIGSVRSLPVLLEALGRGGRELGPLASKAISQLGAEVQPQAIGRRLLGTVTGLLESTDALLGKRARDTLALLKLGPGLLEELAQLTRSEDLEVARWAIARLGELGGKLAARALVPVARGADRARAEAAARALAALPEGVGLLVSALTEADDEMGSEVLAAALLPRVTELTQRQLNALREAGESAFARSIALARRRLEPLRAAAPELWAEALRQRARQLERRDPSGAEEVWATLTRSSVATEADRVEHARLKSRL